MWVKVEAYTAYSLSFAGFAAKKMAHPYDVDMALIREISEQERQAEEDRIFAARLAGVPFDRIPDDARKMAILPDGCDDSDEDETIERMTSRSKP